MTLQPEQKRLRRTPDPRMVRMAHGTLRACLNQAMRAGLLLRNVATLVKLPKQTHRENARAHT